MSVTAETLGAEAELLSRAQGELAHLHMDSTTLDSMRTAGWRVTGVGYFRDLFSDEVDSERRLTDLFAGATAHGRDDLASSARLILSERDYDVVGDSFDVDPLLLGVVGDFMRRERWQGGDGTAERLARLATAAEVLGQSPVKRFIGTCATHVANMVCIIRR